MFQRKKDGGFTLIELMIVIAVIGILAIVLVPKVSAIKTQAKSAGLDTNFMTVQGYVESRINTWLNDSTTFTEGNIENEIDTNLAEIENPFTNGDGVLIVDEASAGEKGSINVIATRSGTTLSIKITAYDNNSTTSNKVVYKTTTINP